MSCLPAHQFPPQHLEVRSDTERKQKGQGPVTGDWEESNLVVLWSRAGAQSCFGTFRAEKGFTKHLCNITEAFSQKLICQIRAGEVKRETAWKDAKSYKACPGFSVVRWL